MFGLRDVDRWFIDEILTHEDRFLAAARRFCTGGDAGRDEAADLVHDVYARILSGEGWRVMEDPRAYVLTMIRNLGIQRLRRARIVHIESLFAREARDPVSPEPDAFDQTAGRERLKQALQALLALPPRCREVVELRRLHDLSTRDIAKRLGLSLSTVEKRLARGMVLMTLAMETVEPAARTPSEPLAGAIRQRS